MIKKLILMLILFVLLTTPFGHALFFKEEPIVVKTSTHHFVVKVIAKGLKNPWGLAFLPDGRMLVTERHGIMRIIDKKGVLSDPLKGLPSIAVIGQGGLLDVVLAPDFAKSKKIYFSYAEPDEKDPRLNSTAVSYAILNESGLENVTRVFSQTPKVQSAGHFGSRLVWASDGTLFITTGDRQIKQELAQTLDNHIGKVIRINADGSIPSDNPFVKMSEVMKDIWSYGHRNIQGAALHPITQQLWTLEHGPQGGDELNLTLAGKNYGWPVITYGENYGGGKIGQGTHKEGMEQPMYYWTPSIATGGFIFYTGDAFPQWKNNIFITGLKFKILVRLVLDGNKVIKEERFLQDELDVRLRQVVQGPDGLIYVLSDEREGKIYQLSPVND
jgi:aldose sugar dehydrogenase